MCNKFIQILRVMTLVSVLYGRVVSSQFQTKLYIVACNSTSTYKNTINLYKKVT